MVDKLLEEFEHKIERLDVVPSRGGVYEVTADGELIFSKKAVGRHPEYEEVAAPLRDLVG